MFVTPVIVQAVNVTSIEIKRKQCFSLKEQTLKNPDSVVRGFLSLKRITERNATSIYERKRKLFWVAISELGRFEPFYSFWRQKTLRPPRRYNSTLRKENDRHQNAWENVGRRVVAKIVSGLAV